MTVTDAIDTAIAAAEALGAKPFRLELQPHEMDALRAAGALDPKPEEHDSCTGVCHGVKVYPATKLNELLAQPEDALLAVHLPIEALP